MVGQFFKGPNQRAVRKEYPRGRLYHEKHSSEVLFTVHSLTDRYVSLSRLSGGKITETNSLCLR